MSHEIRRSFEEDFARHLLRRAHTEQVVCGAVGGLLAGVFGYVGLAVFPLLVLGPLKVCLASIVGITGASQWAWRRSQREFGSEDVIDPSELGANALAAIAGIAPPRPTIRRLKRVVKWAFRLLSRNRGLSAEWRLAVFTEAVCAFSPWAQRAHFLHAARIDKGGTRTCRGSSSEAASESLQHLLPLYRFLQRHVAMEAALELAARVAATRDVTSRGTTGQSVANNEQLQTTSNPFGYSFIQVQASSAFDGRCLALATLLATLGAMCPLDEDEIQALRFGSSKRVLGREVWRPWVRRNVCAMPNHGQHCLQRIAGAARLVLRPAEVREALSCVPPMVLRGDASLTRDSGDDDDAEFLSISSDHSEREGPGSGYDQRQVDFTRGKGPHTWNSYDPANFKLRGPNYFIDGKKITSGPGMLDLVDIDFCRIGPHGPVVNTASHGDFTYANFRKRGDKRFLWLFNWIIPPYQVVIAAALDPVAPWLHADCPQFRVWNRFLEADPEERRCKLKLIFSVETGPWVVKKLAIKKPSLIGKKLSMVSKHVAGDYIEITMDVTNGGQGGGYEEMVTGMVLKHVKHIEMCLCCLIEATEEDELPETALFAACCTNVDFNHFLVPVNAASSASGD